MNIKVMNIKHPNIAQLHKPETIIQATHIEANAFYDNAFKKDLKGKA